MSEAANGRPARRQSHVPAVSGDGRFVTFESTAQNLIPGESYRGEEIYLRDQGTGTTTLVSHGKGSRGGNGISRNAQITADGGYLAFDSDADNLVRGIPLIGYTQTYRYDRVADRSTIVSRALDGGSPNANCGYPQISDNGRFVTYNTEADNVVAGDTNDAQDVFLTDTRTGTTSLVSRALDGGPADGDSWGLAVSPDGRNVLIGSEASNLVPGDTPGRDFFLADMQTGEITVLTRRADGGIADGQFVEADLSADGAWVTFHTDAAGMVEEDPVGGDELANQQLYLREVSSGATQLITRSVGGGRGNGDSTSPSISADGSVITFASEASNLVPGGSNRGADIFVWTAQAGSVSLVSKSPNGEPADDLSETPEVSADGTFITYSSEASNLVPNYPRFLNNVFLYRLAP